MGMRKLFLILLLTVSVAGYSQPMRALIAKKATGSAWAHKASVTTDQTDFNGGDVSDFRFVVTTTQTSLKTVSNGGSIRDFVSRPGAVAPLDFIVTSDVGGSVLLNWDFEFWDPTTGEAVLWVKLPTLSASADITIYLWWGNASITTWQGGSTGSVYGASCAMLYHLNDLAGDSGPNSNNGTNTGVTSILAKIGYGGSFNGSSRYITIPYSSTLNCTSGITIHAWINSASTNRSVVGKMFAATHTSPFFDWNMYYASGPRLNLRVGSTTNTSTNTVSNSTWIHVVLVANGTDHRIYINGTLDRTITTSVLPTNTNSQPVRIGANATPGEYFNGTIDEVEVFSAAQSADWVAYSYANQNNPSSTYTFTVIF